MTKQTNCSHAIQGIRFNLSDKGKTIFLCTTPEPCHRKIEKFFCSNPILIDKLTDCPMKTGSGEPQPDGSIIKTVPKNCQLNGCKGKAPMSEDKMKVCKYYKEMNEVDEK